jgi:hypothetical protein
VVNPREGSRAVNKNWPGFLAVGAEAKAQLSIVSAAIYNVIVGNSANDNW